VPGSPDDIASGGCLIPVVCCPASPPSVLLFSPSSLWPVGLAVIKVIFKGPQRDNVVYWKTKRKIKDDHGSKRGLLVEPPMAGDELTCWAGTKKPTFKVKYCEGDIYIYIYIYI